MFYYNQVTFLLTSKCIFIVSKKIFCSLKKNETKKKTAEDSLIVKYFISESTVGGYQ